MPGGEGKLGGEVGMQGGRKKRYKEEEEAGPRHQADQRTAEVTGAVDGKSQALMSRNMGLGSPLALLESFLLELLPSSWTFSCSALLLSSCFFSTLKEGFYLPSEIPGVFSQHVTHSSQDIKGNNQSFE